MLRFELIESDKFVIEEYSFIKFSIFGDKNTWCKCIQDDQPSNAVTSSSISFFTSSYIVIVVVKMNILGELASSSQKNNRDKILIQVIDDGKVVPANEEKVITEDVGMSMLDLMIIEQEKARKEKEATKEVEATKNSKSFGESFKKGFLSSSKPEKSKQKSINSKTAESSNGTRDFPTLTKKKDAPKSERIYEEVQESMDKQTPTILKDLQRGGIY